jgi:hypothetical protein
MRVAVPVIALALATSAAAEPPATTTPQRVIVQTPLQALSAPPGTSAGRTPCRDTIHEVREARGLPGEAIAPEPGQLIAAVDHRINGCSVMVMYGNTSDVRPLPAMPDGPPQLQRIPGG